MKKTLIIILAMLSFVSYAMDADQLKSAALKACDTQLESVPEAMREQSKKTCECNVNNTDYAAVLEAQQSGDTEKVQQAALAAHQALGIEIYSRVDVLLDAENNPYVLEANTIPGMTASSLLPKAAKVAGYDFGPLCRKIAELSLAARTTS